MFKSNKITNLKKKKKKTILNPHVYVSYDTYDSLIQYNSYDTHLCIGRFMSTYNMKFFVHDTIRIAYHTILTIIVQLIFLFEVRISVFALTRFEFLQTRGKLIVQLIFKSEVRILVCLFPLQFVATKHTSIDSHFCTSTLICSTSSVQV